MFRGVSRPNVVMPWEPTEPGSWHPDLQRSLQEKARQRGIYDQSTIDRQVVVAAGIRIITEWGITALPKGDAPGPSAERQSIMVRLEKEIVARRFI